MGLFNKTLNTFDDLLMDQLHDLYDAELRLTEALPKMAEAAESVALKQAFESHLQETHNHVARLESIFAELGLEAERETCDAMKGLISEGAQMIKADAEHPVKDAGLIAAAQRVEHYEMAGYGTARQFAAQLGHSHVAELLEQTLQEEKQADRRLTEIAESSVNARAERALPR